jgi:hypothetical protein
LTRKIVVALVVFVSALLLLTAMNQAFINRIKQDRYFDHLSSSTNKPDIYHQVFIRSDRWGYGDLYGLSYLPQYKLKLAPFHVYPQTLNNVNTGRVLYILGDSFLADKTLDGAFEGFERVIFVDRRFPPAYLDIDKAKKKYLIMEYAERNLSNLEFEDAVNIPASGNMASTPTAIKPTGLFTRVANIIFNKELSRNIELLCFDDKAFTPFKELKATLNYRLFNRVVKEVAVSTDEKRLFLNMSVDTASRQSAFRSLSNKQVNAVIGQLANSDRHYKAMGFSKVLLAVIPNAVSVYDKHRGPYNRLLEKVEAQTSLPVISLYADYQKSKSNLFYLSDAHWNPEGLDIWLATANRALQDTVQR